jgi:hypothetical protein
VNPQLIAHSPSIGALLLPVPHIIRRIHVFANSAE